MPAYGSAPRPGSQDHRAGGDVSLRSRDPGDLPVLCPDPGDFDPFVDIRALCTRRRRVGRDDLQCVAVAGLFLEGG